NAPPSGSYPFALTRVATAAQDNAGTPSHPALPVYEIDCRPLVRAVVEDCQRATARAEIARRFHSTMVDVIVKTCEQLRRDTDLERVVLSGGVFLNALLARETVRRLKAASFAVFRHRQVPPNDGGICLGQLAIAAASYPREARPVAESANLSSIPSLT